MKDLVFDTFIIYEYKLTDRDRRWLKGSIFISYYNKMEEKG